jgi:hypothetical protein
MKTILCIGLMIGSVCASAQWTVDREKKMLYNGGVEISYEADSEFAGGTILTAVKNHPSGDWTLDELPRIEQDTGLCPTAIGSGFAGRQKNLRSFLLPDSVRRIGRAAFFSCSNATNSLALPALLERLDRAAFFGCEKLSGDLVIPPHLTEIAPETFYGCGGIKSLAFAQGSKIERIEWLAFKRCWGLRGTVDFTPCTRLERIDPEAFISCTPERVIFGEEFKKRVDDALHASDATNGYPRASTDWLAGSFGIGVHWTTWSTDQDGEKNSFDEAVEAFDVPRFVAQVKDSGARHIIFTSSWAEQHPPAPCAALDRILEGRTTKRNLLKEIADALAAEGIRTILYYNHGCNGEDKQWMKACGYSDANLEQFGSNIVSIVRDLSLGCGKNISGWWFDSPGAVSDAGPHRTASVKLGDYKFPFRELALAAKAGNPSALVSINSQGGTFIYSPCQEYFSGEELHEFPLCGRTNAQGMQMHIWSTMDNKRWVHQGTNFSPLRFSDEWLGNFVRSRLADGCAVTLNVDVDRTGFLNPAAIAQLSRINRPGFSRAAPAQTIQLEGYGLKAQAVFKRRLLDERAQGEVFEEAVNAFRTKYDDVHPEANDWTKGLGLWQGEYWGKCILSHVACARISGSAEHRKFIRNKALEFIRAFQREDGYLSSYANEDYLCGYCCWNIWSRKYTMWALIEAYDLTGEKELLSSAAKMADHLIAQLDRLKMPIVNTGCFVGMPSMSILKPMVLLFERTGEKRYLDFANYIVSENDREDSRAPNLIANSFGPKPVHEWYPEPEKWAKAYEMMSLAEGFIEYSRVTGDMRPFEATKRLWEKLYDYELNGLFGAGFHDHFVHGKARASVITEICDSIHWMRLCRYLHEATGDMKYLDAWEKAYLNAYLGGINRDGFWGPHDMRGHGTRHQQMPGEVSMKYHLCCIANVPRALGDWGSCQIVQNKKWIDVNFYTDCEWSGDGLKVKISGDYPVGDKVTVKVSSASKTSIRLRVPAWCPKMTVGSAVAAAPGCERLVLPVNAGESEFTIAFEMPVRIDCAQGVPVNDEINAKWFESLHVNPEMKGYTRTNFAPRVMRGPLVLAKSRNSGCSRETVFGEIPNLDSTWKASVSPAPRANIDAPDRPWGLWRLELSKGSEKYIIPVCDVQSAADFDDDTNFFSIRF